MKIFRVGLIGTGVISDIYLKTCQKFNIWDSQLPRLEIYGTEGTICIPEPDPVDGPPIFGGEVFYKTRETARWSYKPKAQGLEKWDVVVNSHGYNEDARGLGLADMRS